MMGHYGNWNMMGGYGLFGGIFTLILWVIIIAAIIALVSWLGRQGRGWQHGGHDKEGGETALDILKERYARGEINRQEYEEKRKDLEL